MARSSISTTAISQGEFNPAKHYEAWADSVTSNTTWKLTTLLLIAGLVVSMVVISRQSRQIASVANQRIVVRIDDVGRQESVSYKPSEYKPEESEVKYFLTQFTHNYFARVHQTVVRDYGNSFYFISQDLSDRLNNEDRKTNWLSKFLASDADDCEVNVTVPVIDDLSQQPYRAHVEWEKVCTARGGTETIHEKYVTQYQFRVQPQAKNDWIKYNPLGLVITYFRSDEYFGKEQ